MVKTSWLCEFFPLWHSSILTGLLNPPPPFICCSGDNTGEVTIFNNVVI